MQIFLSLVIMGLSVLVVYQAVKLRESREKVVELFSRLHQEKLLNRDDVCDLLEKIKMLERAIIADPSVTVFNIYETELLIRCVEGDSIPAETLVQVLGKLNKIRDKLKKPIYEERI